MYKIISNATYHVFLKTSHFYTFSGITKLFLCFAVYFTIWQVLAVTGVNSTIKACTPQTVLKN